jgi:hypothetical protein
MFINTYSFADISHLKAMSMRKIGCSKEEILHELIKDYNELQDIKFSMIPFFGKRLAKSQYLNEEELMNRIKNIKINT